MYDNAGLPYALRYTVGAITQTYYYITNLQGDVVSLVDARGNEVAAYSYDAYGQVVSATGVMAEVNPLRYRGYCYDSDSGFYYLQSRYYDPVVCRFINADSYSGTGTGVLGYNMFAYCNGNPVNYTDPSGHIFEELASPHDDEIAQRKPRRGRDNHPNEDDNLDQSHLRRSYARSTPHLNPEIMAMSLMSGTDTSSLVGMTGPYWYLRILAYGKGLEVHHLIEQRFWALGSELRNSDYPGPYNAPSVILTKSGHQSYTNDYRAAFPYGKTDYKNITVAQLQVFVKNEYAGHGDWIDHICSNIH